MVFLFMGDIPVSEIFVKSERPLCLLIVSSDSSNSSISKNSFFDNEYLFCPGEIIYLKFGLFSLSI